MTNEERIFFDALKQPDPSARRAVVQRACGEDVELRRAVEALLAAHERDGPSFESIPVQANADVLDPLEVLAIVRKREAEDVVGTSVGPYTLTDRIGEGAMGSVYVAEQQYPLRRTVALKLIKSGIGSRQVVARFDAERQAVALMDHPCIAKVLDAGSTESGRPYFVMEFVRGTPITRFCQDASLDVASRLRLFVQVCRAVQHAHGRGIIHRDLKPTNVLVTVIDGQPVPKVIDFGIAKAMANAQSGGHGLLDATASRIAGTPMYMSPEQAAGGDDVDTRSDVYGLGALLYELLSGRPPFDQSLEGASPDEVRCVLGHETPPPPSEVLAPRAGPDRQPGGLSPDARRWLRRDLDWIVARAMCKDPSGRYPTADALAADVERALADEPVVARPRTRAYAFVKFLRRHRRSAAAVAAVALALTAGMVGTAVGMIRAKHQRDQAVAAQVQAMQQKALAEATSKCLEDVLAAANPWESGADGGGRSERSVRQMLDLAARRLEAIGAQPQVESSVRFSLGLAYQGLGLFQEAETQLRQALQLQQRATAGRDDHELARRMSALSAVLPVVKRLPEAEALAHEVVAMRERLHGKTHPEYARALDLLASVLRQRGANAPAMEAAREALHLRRTLPPYPEAEESLARSLTGLARVLDRSGDAAGAIPLLREALEIDRRTLPPDHPRLANTLASLASILDDRPEGAAEAAELYGAALRIRRRYLPEHHFEVSDVVRALSRRLQLDLKFEACEALLEERKARLGERISGDDQLELCGQFAALYDAWGRVEDRRRWQDGLQNAFARELEHADADGGVATAVALTNRAAAYARAGRFDDAAVLFEEAICADADRINAWCNQGLLLAYLGRTSEYEQLCRLMVDRFGHSDDRNVLIHLLPPCLAAGGHTDASMLSRHADLLESLCKEQRQLPIAMILKGIARYRCGDDAAALAALVAGRSCEYTGYRAAGAYFESLANRRLGRTADADLAFERGSRIVRELPKPGISDVTKRNLNAWFLAHVAQRQATERLFAHAAGR